MAGVSDFPVGVAVVFMLGKRSAPISCSVTEHVPAGTVETSPGEMTEHPDLLVLTPNDGGFEITARVDQVKAA